MVFFSTVLISKLNTNSRSVQFSYIKDPYRILEFSEAVGFAIG
jgi:hypothetical protein